MFTFQGGGGGGRGRGGRGGGIEEKGQVFVSKINIGIYGWPLKRPFYSLKLGSEVLQMCSGCVGFCGQVGII